MVSGSNRQTFDETHSLLCQHEGALCRAAQLVALLREVHRHRKLCGLPSSLLRRMALVLSVTKRRRECGPTARAAPQEVAAARRDRDTKWPGGVREGWCCLEEGERCVGGVCDTECCGVGGGGGGGVYSVGSMGLSFQASV